MTPIALTVAPHCVAGEQSVSVAARSKLPTVIQNSLCGSAAYCTAHQHSAYLAPSPGPHCAASVVGGNWSVALSRFWCFIHYVCCTFDRCHTHFSKFK